MYDNVLCSSLFLIWGSLLDYLMLCRCETLWKGGWKMCSGSGMRKLASYFNCYTLLTFRPVDITISCVTSLHHTTSLPYKQTTIFRTLNTAERCFFMYMWCVPWCVFVSRWAHFSCLWRVTVKRTTGCGALRQNLCQRTSGSSCSHSLSGWWCWTMSSETQVRVCLCWHFHTVFTELKHSITYQSNFVTFLFLQCRQFYLYWLTDFGNDKNAMHHILLKWVHTSLLVIVTCVLHSCLLTLSACLQAH